MNRRQRDARRETGLDAALLIAWAVFALIVLLH